MKKFVLQLVMIQVIVLIIIGIAFFRDLSWSHNLALFTSLFFLVITFSTGWIGWKGMQKDPESAVNYLLSAIGMHFMSCLIGVALAIILITGYDLLFVGWFFSFYILYTCFVVWSLMTTLRPHLRPSNSTDK